jgi:hypothetical protein
MVPIFRIPPRTGVVLDGGVVVAGVSLVAGVDVVGAGSSFCPHPLKIKVPIKITEIPINKIFFIN